jgi:hypothetical protein
MRITVVNAALKPGTGISPDNVDQFCKHLNKVSVVEL